MPLLSPSSSSRWINCPGSKHANLLPEGKSNAAADRGTKSHGDATFILQASLQNPDNSSIKHEEEIVNRYVDFVTGLNGEKYLEETCYSAECPDLFFGTIDALVVNKEEIWVVDLKTGQLPVSAHDNDQLQCYLNLARDRYPCTRRYFGVIVQDTIRIEEYTEHQLNAHYDLVRRAAQSEVLRAGPWCTYCLLALTCKTRESWMYEQASVVFDDVEPSVDDCKKVINLEPVVTAMAELAKKSLRTKMLRGEKVDGWRLAQPLGNRQWISEQCVRSWLFHSEYNKEEFLEPAVLKSPAQIKKLVGKSGEEFIEAHVIRPKKPVIAVPESSSLPEFVSAGVFVDLGGKNTT